MKTLSFTRAKLAKLKAATAKAKADRQEQFLFEGLPFVVRYAEYLIEYLELNFKPDTRKLTLDEGGFIK